MSGPRERLHGAPPAGACPPGLLAREFAGERDRAHAVWWLGWLACRAADGDRIDWWEIPELLPVRQVRWAQLLAYCALAAVVAAASLAMLTWAFSAWYVLYWYLAGPYLVVQALGKGVRGIRAGTALPPVSPRVVVPAWPRRHALVRLLPAVPPLVTLPPVLVRRWTAPAAAQAPAGSYQSDRRASVAVALAWLPAGALAGSLLCGWGGAGAWPGVVLVQALGVAAGAGMRRGAYPRLKLAELALAVSEGERVCFSRLLEDCADRGVLLRSGGGYEFRDAGLRAELAAAGRAADDWKAAELARRMAREGAFFRVAAALSPSRINRVNVDFTAGAATFLALGIPLSGEWVRTACAAMLLAACAAVALTARSAGSLTGEAITLLWGGASGLALLGGIGALAAWAAGLPSAMEFLAVGLGGYFAVGLLLLAYRAAGFPLRLAAAAASRMQASVPDLSRGKRVIVTAAAAAVAVAVAVAVAGTALARGLAFALPGAFVAACGSWACRLAFLKWRGPASRLRRAPDVIAAATIAAVLLVVAKRGLLSTQWAAVLLFPVGAAASVRLWRGMRDSRRLAVTAGADITLSLLLGAEVVLFLVWLGNVLGMTRAEEAALRSALAEAGSAAGACLDWRVWLSAYAALAAASVAFAVWPARLRAVSARFDRLRVADTATAGQRVLTGLNISMLTITLVGAAAPGALAPVLQRQVRETYIVALQRQLEADGKTAAYAEITREFGRPVTFPVLAEVVRDVHDESREPGGQRHTAAAEEDLARRVGMLQAAAIQSQGATTLAGAEQASASREGLGGPLRDPADLGHRVAETEAQEDKGDTAGKRLELASELAARAVANTLSIPQLGSNEIVQIVTGYLSGLIEDSPLKVRFAAWLEHVPGARQPPGATEIVVPDPQLLAYEAEIQLAAEAGTRGVQPPAAADPLAVALETDSDAVNDAVNSARLARDVQRTGACAGCSRPPDPPDDGKPPADDQFPEP